MKRYCVTDSPTGRRLPIYHPNGWSDYTLSHREKMDDAKVPESSRHSFVCAKHLTPKGEAPNDKCNSKKCNEEEGIIQFLFPETGCRMWSKPAPTKKHESWLYECRIMCKQCGFYQKFSPMTANEGIELREKAILLGEKKCSKEDPHVF